jgi:hypothetical protein
MKVAIQRLNLASLGKMGCLLGAVAAFLPSLLCGLLGFAFAALAGRWLESWQDLTSSCRHSPQHRCRSCCWPSSAWLSSPVSYWQ